MIYIFERKPSNLEPVSHLSLIGQIIGNLFWSKKSKRFVNFNRIFILSLFGLFGHLDEVILDTLCNYLEELVVDEMIEFFLELERYFLIIWSNILVYGLQNNGKWILLGFADEIIFKIQGEILLFILYEDSPFKFIQFKFGSGPMR